MHANVHFHYFFRILTIFLSNVTQSYKYVKSQNQSTGLTFLALDPGDLISNFCHRMMDKESTYICLLEIVSLSPPTHGSCG